MNGCAQVLQPRELWVQAALSARRAQGRLQQVVGQAELALVAVAVAVAVRPASRRRVWVQLAVLQPVR
jgi:hypothetical protein